MPLQMRDAIRANAAGLTDTARNEAISRALLDVVTLENVRCVVLFIVFV